MGTPSGATIDYYIRAAGGATPNADLRRAYVTQPNGKVEGVERRFLLPDGVPRPRAGSRVFVPDGEPSASIRTVDPATGTYRSEKYALDAATAEQARKARSGLGFSGCTTDADKLDALARMEADVRALLPPEPNERLVYRCAPAQP